MKIIIGIGLMWTSFALVILLGTLHGGGSLSEALLSILVATLIFSIGGSGVWTVAKGLEEKDK